MFFTKAPHPANASFATAFRDGSLTCGAREIAAALTSYAEGVARLRLTGPEAWIPGQNALELLPPTGEPDETLSIGESGELELRIANSELRLTGRFGVGGDASMFLWDVPEGARFFGQGEKLLGQQELSGFRTQFYNTDVWSDFPSQQWGENPSDPPYFSTPYVVVRLPDGNWVGFLLHNPWPAFMETPGIDDSRVFVSWQKTSDQLILGSRGGTPDLWTITAPDLRTLTMRLQRLVGTTPTPPLWSLGYHQSRWGYGGHEDLLELDRRFSKHEIPCDGLWLDLDYMRGYRIFTVEESQFPEGVGATAKALAESGRRMVPIIDPGIKSELGLELYDNARENGHLALNEEGNPFVGLVWPGETVFPDFTQEATRTWWAGRAAHFLELGWGGAWIDMNDPSTGPVDPGAMRFRQGSEPHEAHRNQYSLFMQRATVEGFRQARPDERPFLLSRSGFVGSSRYGAIWTGDNVSNRFYLASSIPTAIGMSLSGLPFHGMDVGGFGGACEPDLMEDWIKLAFLFPFCRNHSNNGTRPQEPWAYPPATLDLVRRYIRLRYKFLPYSYALWAEHEKVGEPILRPMIYAYDEPGAELLNDQFLIGPDLLQAPFVTEEKTRAATLPGENSWCALDDGAWLTPGVHTIKRKKGGTPIFAREGALIPLRPGTPKSTGTDLRHQHLHLFAPESWTGESETILIADDGLSFGYQRGERTRLRVRVVAADGHLAIETQVLEEGYGPISVALVLHAEPRSVRVDSHTTETRRESSRLTDKSFPVWIVAL